MQIFRLLILTIALIAALSQMTFAQNKDGDFLLTNNGANNPEHSAYKDAPLLKTNGSYYPTPPFANRLRKLGEEGSIKKPIPFATGVLTNGDASINVSHQPMPYAYWGDQEKVSLDFTLGDFYQVTKVCVYILNKSGYGAQSVGIYTKEELLEAGQQPLQEIAPKDGWNEFIIDKNTDEIKLDFTQKKGARFIGVSEVEIWGKPTQAPVIRPEKETASLNLGNQLAFDFGPADSPVVAGFKSVGANTLYSKERGYGWIPYVNGVRQGEEKHGLTQIPGLMERDRVTTGRRGVAGSSISMDDFYRDFVGVERAYTQEMTQEFVVDLPNGKYQIYLASADLIYSHPGKKNIAIDAEGKRVINFLDFDKSFRAHATFSTEVTDGQLNLRISDDSDKFERGWVLNGLLISPINNAQETANASAILQHLNALLQSEQASTPVWKFNFFNYNETQKLFPLTQQQADQGYLLFVRDWMRMVYPNTVPLQREVENAKVEIAGAPTQYATATMGIFPLKSTFKATVAVSDLVNKDKQKIDKDNISLRVTGYMPERIKKETRTAGDYTYYIADSSQGKDVMNAVPKILYPYEDKSSLTIDKTTQLWLTFHIPETAAPGIYHGIITVTPEGLSARTLPISLTVYPFQLQQSDRVQGVYWAPQDMASAKLQIQDMAEHGIRAVTLSNKIVPILRNANGQVEIDLSELDEVMTLMKNAGMTGYIPYSTNALRALVNNFIKANPDVKNPHQVLPNAIAQLYQYSKKNNWPAILFYPVDEIANKSTWDALKYLSELIRKAAPGSKIYTTVNNYAAGLELMNYFDYAATNIPLTREQEQTFLDRGKQYMRYGNGYNFNPRISRTLSGYGLWQRPAVAMYYYHYQLAVGDPMNPLDGTSRDFMLAYPSPNGPLDTIDFEAIREGNNDLRYIKTLQFWMEKAKRAGRAPEVVQQGEAILREITESNPAYDQYDLAGVPNEKYSEWRDRMAQLIMKLQDE